ncbi:unnamed protein product [Didymodactylos carnosus]|uniref:Uncharacterized protein n=1 Tax=Didymodactylos carnosus TaxID=1234261 RepID=A0A815XCR4_9BILA|nr:unnamed protein product [Didymodactylos carnosus]CAF4417123.1 unnamed protein product [Didymodactylos carnosus]
MTSNTQESQLAGDRTATKSSLRLEWIYGYRSANCQRNIHLTSNMILLVHVFIPIKQLLQLVKWVKMHKSVFEISKKLASVGIDHENTIKIWNWNRGKILATVAGHSQRVFDICYPDNYVITCGVKHIRFWTLLGNTLEYKEGKLEAQTLLYIGYFPSLDIKNSIISTDDNSLCFTGAINGDLYVWKKIKSIKLFLEFIHLFSPIPSIRSLAFSMNENQIAVDYENGYIEIY